MNNDIPSLLSRYNGILLTDVTDLLNVAVKHGVFLSCITDICLETSSIVEQQILYISGLLNAVAVHGTSNASYDKIESFLIDAFHTFRYNILVPEEYVFVIMNDYATTLTYVTTLVQKHLPYTSLLSVNASSDEHQRSCCIAYCDIRKSSGYICLGVTIHEDT